MSRSATRCAGEQRRAADAELLVGDRRVDDQDVLATARRAVVVDQLDRRLEDPLGQLARVGDGGAGADEDRVGAVVAADAAQAPDHVGDVAAEEAAVGVQLVDDHELQVLEQLEPLGVVGEDRGVEHVRVGDDDLPGGPHHRSARWAACRRRRCASSGRARPPRPGRAARPAGRLRAPWWGRGRALAPSGRGRWRRGPAGCSRASCPRPSASRRRRCARRGSPRAPGPGACRAPRRRGNGARSRSRGSSPSGHGAWRGGRGSSTRCAAMSGCRAGVGEQRLDGVAGGGGAIGEHDRLQNSTPVLFRGVHLEHRGARDSSPVASAVLGFAPDDSPDALPSAHQRAQRDGAVEPLGRPPGRQPLPGIGQVRVLRGAQRGGHLRHLAALQVPDRRPRRGALPGRHARPRRARLPAGPRPVHDLARRPRLRAGGRRHPAPRARRVPAHQRRAELRLLRRSHRPAGGLDRGRQQPDRDDRGAGPALARAARPAGPRRRRRRPSSG